MDSAKVVIVREEELNERTAARFLVGRTLDDIERAVIMETLELCSGNRTRAAAILGISTRTLRNKLHLYNGDEEGV